MSEGSRHRARQAAVQALYQWDLTASPPDEIESHFIHERNLEGADLAYFHQLVREIPRRRGVLDDYLAPFLEREMQSVDPVERAILRIAAYELELAPEIPYRVIIDEAVELAKTFGAEHSFKFVNGVLDKLAHMLRPAEIKS